MGRSRKVDRIRSRKENTKTQFGFRKHRGTADALFLVRHIIASGEMSKTKTFLLLLDWEKAFDKIFHDKLYESLEYMGVSWKMQRMIKQFYDNAYFYVKIDGVDSDIHKQETGI